jgi:hypothetical protein
MRASTAWAAEIVSTRTTLFTSVTLFSSAVPLDLFGFEKYTFLTGSGRSAFSFSTRLRVLKLEATLM